MNYPFFQKIVIVAVGGGGTSWNIAGGGSGNVNFTTIEINKSLIEMSIKVGGPDENTTIHTSDLHIIAEAGKGTGNYKGGSGYSGGKLQIEIFSCQENSRVVNVVSDMK